MIQILKGVLIQNISTITIRDKRVYCQKQLVKVSVEFIFNGVHESLLKFISINFFVMVKTKKKRCWQCSSLHGIKWDQQLGTNRFKFKQCGTLFSSSNSGLRKKNREGWFREWIVGKQIFKQLPQKADIARGLRSATSTTIWSVTQYATLKHQDLLIFSLTEHFSPISYAQFFIAIATSRLRCFTV